MSLLLLLAPTGRPAPPGIVLRPERGDTMRPDVGIGARPSSTDEPRPDIGEVLAPDAGDVARPIGLRGVPL